MWEPLWLGNCSGCVYLGVCPFHECVNVSLWVCLSPCVSMCDCSPSECLHWIRISSGRPIITRLPAIPRCRMLADRWRNTYLRTIDRNLFERVKIPVNFPNFVKNRTGIFRGRSFFSPGLFPNLIQMMTRSIKILN